MIDKVSQNRERHFCTKINSLAKKKSIIYTIRTAKKNNIYIERDESVLCIRKIKNIHLIVRQKNKVRKRNESRQKI